MEAWLESTALDVGYEMPKNPDLIVSTEKEKADKIADIILKKYFS